MTRTKFGNLESSHGQWFSDLADSRKLNAQSERGWMAKKQLAVEAPQCSRSGVRR